MDDWLYLDKELLFYNIYLMSIEIEKYDVVIVGCGYAGSIIARELANKQKKVLILEKRNHIAGNMYDYYDDKTNILVHKYGPHIGHYDNIETLNYLKQYSEFIDYKHKVLVKTYNNKAFTIPFNINSMEICFGKEKTKDYLNILKKHYPELNKITLGQIQTIKDLKNFYTFIYNNIFRDYTTKMWGLDPSKLDKSIMDRIPIRLTKEDFHFADAFQCQPKNGYTFLFKNILDHENITIMLNTNAADFFSIKSEKIYFNKKEFNKILVWTGPLDELYKYKYGELPYRSLHFKITQKNVDSFQDYGTINFPTKVKKTRTTELKKITVQKNIKDKTLLLTEYPGAFNLKEKNFSERFYPILSEETKKAYKKYKDDSEKIKNLFLCGRLAEYRYYDMKDVITAAINKSKEIY